MIPLQDFQKSEDGCGHFSQSVYTTKSSLKLTICRTLIGLITRLLDLSRFQELSHFKGYQ